MAGDTGRIPTLEELQDREAIRDVVHRFSRGVDRADLEVMKSVYWPDAFDDHGIFEGNAYEFAEFLIPLLTGIDQCMHNVGNIIIDLHGGVAQVESYVFAFQSVTGDDGASTDSLVIGRYLDRFEKRGDIWKIAYRLYVMDWNLNIPTTVEWKEGMYGSFSNIGKRFPEDPLYKFLGHLGKKAEAASAD